MTEADLVQAWGTTIKQAAQFGKGETTLWDTHFDLELLKVEEQVVHFKQACKRNPVLRKDSKLVRMIKEMDTLTAKMAVHFLDTYNWIKVY
jgi:hypothetical protein